MTDFQTGPVVPGGMETSAAPPRTWRQRRWAIAIAGAAVAAVVAGATIAVVDAVAAEHAKTVTVQNSHRAAIQSWWSGAHDDFTALQTAVDDSKKAASRNDENAMYAACQQLHDTAEVSLQGKMPTPDAELTAQVRAMIEDFHLASHMCMSALKGSTNQYAIEYLTYVDQAQRQMRAAQDLINTSVTKA